MTKTKRIYCENCGAWLEGRRHWCRDCRRMVIKTFAAQLVAGILEAVFSWFRHL